MKNYLLVIVLFTQLSVLMAQTQQGYVRSISRPDRKALPIENVVVSVAGIGNSVISSKDGHFSFVCPNSSYRILRVVKNGYQLVDRGVIGRQYPFSSSVRHEIVMVLNSDLEKDKKRIEDNAYKRAETEYKRRLDLIRSQYEEKLITKEFADQAEEELGNSYQNYIEMISDMAERYAMADYEGISAINKQILLFIENAELEKADSLINTKGNIKNRIKELKEQQQMNMETRKLLEKSEQSATFKLNDIAEDCYNKYTIFESNFMNDSAAYYLGQRAELDSTNLEWQSEYGQFLTERLADYDNGMKYLQRFLRQSLLQYGEKDSWTASAYNNIGTLYDYMGEYNLALECHKKSLRIRKEILEDNDPDISYSYNNIAEIYSKLGNNSRALELHEKALELRIKAYGDSSEWVAESYNNIGIAQYRQGDFSNALDNFNKSLDIRVRIYGENNLYVPTSYNNIGMVYYKLNDYEQSIKYLTKSLNVRKIVLGEHHPDVAESYNNIGSVLLEIEKTEEALEYFKKSLEILLDVYGETHDWTAMAYNNVASVYDRLGNYQQALEYFKKSHKILSESLGSDHKYTLDVLTSIDRVAKLLQEGKGAN